MRSRKYRTDKPLALMAFNLQNINKHCHLSDEEASLLQSTSCPIVILQRKASSIISEFVSPGQSTIGFMLPYTPLHLLLLEPEAGYPEALVMTSGNLSEEPISYQDDEALSKLAGVADAFLVHDRPIHMRVDDSVTRVVEKRPYIIRRSRGYAPNPLRLSQDLPEILASGAELKNTFCLSKKNYAFISHHIGDLENYETYRSYADAIDHFERLFRIQPQAIACDMHPDYLATQYARERSEQENLPLFEIQHHHAHLAACLTDNHYQSDNPVIGIIFDGTGYGTDHTIWGGEFLIGGVLSYQRVYHLKNVRMPGANLAIKNPYRMALAHLHAADIDLDDRFNFLSNLADDEKHVAGLQLEKGINSPFTSSMGRLFDAVSAFLGICSKINYEGQAAIELEAISDPGIEDYYQTSLDDGQIDPQPLWQALVQDYLDGIPVSSIAARFHNSIAHLCLNICEEIRAKNGLKTAALSGGVWQNDYLLRKSIQLLTENHYKVLVHKNVPANDGGISLGQLVIAAEMMKNQSNLR
jgi:hydrogenase maturation protein HypF